MINARINYIRAVDDELFNRVIAYGPGDGINRVSATVQNASSIAQYGLREKVETFNDATDRDSLIALAEVYLESHREPVTEIELTFFSDAGSAELESVLYDAPDSDSSTVTYGGDSVLYGLAVVSYGESSVTEGGVEAVTHAGETLAFWKYGDPKEIRRGDTIRIVSQSLGLNTTGTIEEVDWEPGQVTLTINKRRYNLLEVINGPEQEKERESTSLGLPVPLGFRAQRASPGVRVFVNPYTNSRAVGVEVYASTTAFFTPSREYLLVRGTATEFLFPELASGTVWYFKARSYDNQGNHSEFTDQVSAVGGYVDGGRIGEGTITDLTPFASALQPPKLVVSLPEVHPGDPDYEINDLVALDGDLYQLAGQTGVPEADWDLLEDLAVLDGRLVVGRLVSAQIEAGAIRAEQIAADAVTADKVLVNGPITVANEDTAQDGAFVVLDGASQEVLRLGAGIDGKSGVPNGVDYGLWGAAGTGVFLEGYGYITDPITWAPFTTWAFPAASGAAEVATFTNTSDEIDLPYNVSTTAFLMTATAGIRIPENFPSNWAMQHWQVASQAFNTLDSLWYTFPVSGITGASAGVFSKVRVVLEVRIVSVASGSAATIDRAYAPGSVIIF